MQKYMLPKILGFCAVIALVGFGLQKFINTPKKPTSAPKTKLIQLRSPDLQTMSTNFYFRAVFPEDKSSRVNQQFQAALDGSLKAMEAVTTNMNIYRKDSEISKFNRCAPDKNFILSPNTLKVMKYAHEVYKQSDGTFDATAKPLIMIWKNLEPKRVIKDPVTQKVMQEIGGIPTDAELKKARQSSKWSDIKLTKEGAIRLNSTVCVDLGGIAKGYAIDLATDAIKKAGSVGGLVNIGGDVRCFGKDANGKKWLVGVRNPFIQEKQELLVALAISNNAVCTSGNYERRKIIDGVSYSHIVNPQTLKPADLYPSVTVIAPTAMIADAWATALSVLGPKGFKLIEPLGIEALIVVGTKDKHEIKMTPGFEKFIYKQKKK